MTPAEFIAIADVFENPTISEFSHKLECVTWKKPELKKPGLLARLRKYFTS
jgi:hypothetical protein